jgi:hypothetical protein
LKKAEGELFAYNEYKDEDDWQSLVTGVGTPTYICSVCNHSFLYFKSIRFGEGLLETKIFRFSKFIKNILRIYTSADYQLSCGGPSYRRSS